jgi:uncharacterized protein (DUF433 family)
MQSTPYITRDRGIFGGKPIIRGTRIAVDDISTYLSYGLGVEDIKKAYPSLTDKQIKATLDYLDQQVHREREKLEPTTT